MIKIMFINRDKPAKGQNTLSVTSDKRTIQALQDAKKNNIEWFNKAVILLSDINHI